MPVVSVIIPYSPDHTPSAMLREAKHSVRNQSVPTEVIAVEAGDSPAEARNIGLERATARYVAFLDADDLWRPDKLTRQLRRMRETDAGLCLDAEPMTIDDFFFELFVGDLNDVMSSVLVDTERVSTRFEDRLVRWEDHLFAMEAATEAGVCFCPDLFVHREHERSVTAGETDPEHYLEQGKRYVSFVLDRVPEARPFAFVFYKRMYFLTGWYLFWGGAYRRAITYFRRSLQIGVSPYPIVGLIAGAVCHVCFDILPRAVRRDEG